jgi:hypothetical protein
MDTENITFGIDALIRGKIAVINLIIIKPIIINPILNLSILLLS